MLYWFLGLLISKQITLTKQASSSGGKKTSAANNMDSLKPVHRNFGEWGTFAFVDDKIIESLCYIMTSQAYINMVGPTLPEEEEA